MLLLLSHFIFSKHAICGASFVKEPQMGLIQAISL